MSFWLVTPTVRGRELHGLARIERGLLTVTTIEGRVATTQLGLHPPESLARLLLAELSA